MADEVEPISNFVDFEGFPCQSVAAKMNTFF